MKNRKSFIIREKVEDESAKGFRLDVYITEKVGLCSRSQLKSRIEKIILNGKEAKLSRHVETGDELIIYYTDPPEINLKAENIKLNILYEDNNVVVIDKQQGMVVHPASGHYSGTLVNALLYHYNNLKVETGLVGSPTLRPGIVHRLDKDTSGVLIVAKNIRAQEFLAEQFRNREVQKTYLAVIKGAPSKLEGMVTALLIRDPFHRKRFRCSDIKGKEALTNYRVLKFAGRYSFIVLRPKTGRTHQLRVHMRHIGCPVLGDSLYARKDNNYPDISMMLHAYKLSVKLPGESNITTFRAPLPLRFKKLLSELDKTY